MIHICLFKNSENREWRLGITETIIILGIAISVGIVNDKTKPKEYYYEDRIVTVYKKYQCPKHCQVNHFHYVYFDSLIVEPGQMLIDKEKIGEEYKKDDRKMEEV